MKRANFFKPIVILCTSITRLVFVAFALYVIFNYPRKAETFEINSLNPTQRILIATQSSDFKDELTKILCDSLKDTSTTIKGIDVGGLPEINDEDWDRILIMNSFIIQLNKDVDQFITRALAPQKILAFVTSGGADWLPKPDIEIDAFTSASKKMVINDLVELITDWMGKEDDEDWEPDDYLLALNYFPQVNVKVACEAISSEKERYLAKYPDLENLINRAGYQLLRFKEVQSALEVFMMNIRLFPDSWNVYDSYGEALLIDGERESALSSYRKAVKLNPESKSTNDMLKKLSRK